MIDVDDMMDVDDKMDVDIMDVDTIDVKMMDGNEMDVDYPGEDEVRMQKAIQLNSQSVTTVNKYPVQETPIGESDHGYHMVLISPQSLYKLFSFPLVK